MKTERLTKKEQQELLLHETKKTLQKELAHLKKRKILTSEELIKMKEIRQWWDERLNMKKKWTPLEELQFYSWLDKRRLVGPKVERMIFNCKPGPYDQSLKELEYFDIHVRDLLLRILRLKEERAMIIEDKEKIIRIQEGNEKIIKMQESTIKLLKDNIQLYRDLNIDQTETMNRYAN